MPRPKYPKGTELCETIRIWIGHAEFDVAGDKPVAADLREALGYAEDLVDYLRVRYERAREQERAGRSQVRYNEKKQ
jgi:hypothetical protein